MFEVIDRHAPEDPTHRLVAAVVAAVVGILAVGDALNVIYFPMYQLGLPEWANPIVFVFGVGLLVATYRLVQLSIGEADTGVAVTPPAADGGFDDRDPEQILKTRFARGELTEDEFEEMKAHLATFDDSGAASGESTAATGSPTESYDSPQEFAENHELHNRETIID